MKYYLSGPMTGYPECNFPAFETASAALRARGFDVLSAHEVLHRGEDGRSGQVPYLEMLKEDVRQLLTCDAIVLLPGWEASKGATFEHFVAAYLKMPAFLWDGVAMLA